MSMQVVTAKIATDAVNFHVLPSAGVGSSLGLRMEMCYKLAFVRPHI